MCSFKLNSIGHNLKSSNQDIYLKHRNNEKGHLMSEKNADLLLNNNITDMMGLKHETK